MSVPEKKPGVFYLPIEMAKHKNIVLLKKHGSITSLLRAQLKRKPTQVQIDYFWLKICEERYKYDFEFFAISCCTIRHKTEGEYIRFKLNEAQRLALDVFETERKSGMQILANILKAKQMGFSTLVEMYMKWIQTIHKINWNSLVCAHDLTAARNIRSMYKKSLEEMPAVNGVQMSMASFEGTENIKEIIPRGCRITVGSAEKPETIRSQDIKMVHFSEMAFFPDTPEKKPEKVESSVISSMTDGPNTMIIRETTANGEGDYFYDQWQKAKDGETAYRNIFAPFYIISIYEEKFDGNYYKQNGRKKKGTVADFINTLTEYELNLWNNHKLCTLENLNWRRKKAATMPSETKMKQEYPADDDEAFQASGSPVFNKEHVKALMQDCCPPVAVGTMISRCDPAISIVEPHRRKEILQNVNFVKDAAATDLVLNGDKATRLKAGVNKVHIWEYPDTVLKISNRYLVVFDPQKGRTEKADYGVIKVLDRYWMMYGEEPQVVAMFYGHIDKDITIWIAAQIAKYYNNAKLVIESNTYDTSQTKEDETEFIFDTIAEHYNNLYARPIPAEKIIEGAPVKWGFHMNRNTKPMLISKYSAIIRERGYVERDEETLNEALIYENKPDGTTGAKEGKHDDRIEATMIGLHVCYEMPLPAVIKPPTTESVPRTAW